MFAVIRHVSRYIGPIDFVLRETHSHFEPPIDLHHVPATEERAFQTFVTSGMSERAMKVPGGAEELAHAELMIRLPPGWPLGKLALRKKRYAWPVQELQKIARLPSRSGSWLGCGHTVVNGSPPEPYAFDTRLCGFTLVHPESLPVEFGTLRIDGRKIWFFQLIPLYLEEIALELAEGPGALLGLLRRSGISDILDPGRPNLCPRALEERLVSSGSNGTGLRPRSLET